jgi:WD40 repeat protein
VLLLFLLLLQELSNHRDVVQHLSWSSSGRWLASVSRDQVLCVQDATRQYHVTHLLLAPQKRHLAAAGAVPGSNQCSSLALSEDEQYLASCSWDPKAGRHSLLVMGLAQLDVACSIPCSAPAVR